MAFEWYEAIKKIKQRLADCGYSTYYQEVNEAQLGGSTSSEILLRVCSKLLDIKIKDQEVYDQIRSDSEKLIRYCNSIGLFPQPGNLFEN
jgi:hypothetical protein